MTKAKSLEAELEVEIVETTETSVDEAPAPPTEAPVDIHRAELEARLAEAEQKAAEYLDNFQRAQAAFANFRKRTEAEQVTMRKVANAALLTRLLPVMDDFRRAFQALPDDLQGNAWIEGITLIQRKVAALLEIEEVKRIEVQPGDAFDPLFHQAILYQELAGYDEGQIITEVEQGYVLGERVLRPSMVVVAKAPPPPTATVAETPAEGENQATSAPPAEAEEQHE